jgi:hypothetical protein
MLLLLKNLLLLLLMRRRGVLLLVLEVTRRLRHEAHRTLELRGRLGELPCRWIDGRLDVLQGRLDEVHGRLDALETLDTTLDATLAATLEATLDIWNHGRGTISPGGLHSR